MSKAIETRYAGHRFRSRLEARWAVFFDVLGLAWSYEPEGYGLGEVGAYLPDFFVPKLNGGVFFEVKPDGYLPDAGEERLWLTFSQEIRHPLIVLRGTPGLGPYIGTTLARSVAGWETYAFIVDLLSDHEGVKLWPRPEGDAARQRAPWRAIHTARSARFEYGDALQSRAAPEYGETWKPVAPLISGLMRRVEEAIAARDDEAGHAAHQELIAAEIAAWAPWRRHG